MQGQYPQALAKYQQALELVGRAFGEDRIPEGVLLDGMAKAHQAMGEYTKAEPLYQRSLEIREQKLGKEHPDVAAGLNNLAGLYKAMGQYAKAEPLYQRSLEIKEAGLGKDHPAVATGLNNLAYLYQDMGQYAKAEPLYQRSLKIRERELGNDHPLVAASLNNLAELYRTGGQYPKAEPLYQRSLEIWERKLGKEHPDVATGLNNLAKLYKAMGQYAKAEPLYQRSLEIYEQKLGKDHPFVATGLNNLAGLCATQGQTGRAAVLFHRARRVARRHTGTVLPALAPPEQLAYLRHKFLPNLHGALSLGYQQSEDPALAALSAEWLLNGKAVAQEALALSALLARDSRDPQLADLARQLDQARRQLAQLTLRAPPPGQEADHARQRQALAEREAQLAARLRQAGSSAAPPDWVGLRELRDQLPEGSVLVDIARLPIFDFKAPPGKGWQPARYIAWVTLPAGDVRLVDLGPAAKIDAAVAQLSRALREAPALIRSQGEPAAEEALRPQLSLVSMLVLGPLRPYLREASDWLISPDGELWLVPWAALPLDASTYAVEKHTVRLLVSGRDLLAPSTPALQRGAPLLLANPDFDLGRPGPGTAQPGPERALGSLTLGRVGGLPWTEAEAQALAPRLEAWLGAAPRRLTGAQATEAALRQARHPGVLVLSTHGFFLEDQRARLPEGLAGGEQTRGAVLTAAGVPLENPLLRCGLLLAGCNRGSPDAEDDGVLTGLEVVGCELRGCALVVLSACDTGLGEVHSGEGVSGLRQAFQLAGASSVLASLWQVPDRQTAQLMVAFFDRLAAGQQQGAALAGAQRGLIGQRRERGAAAHPYYWAAFSVTGAAPRR